MGVLSYFVNCQANASKMLNGSSCYLEGRLPVSTTYCGVRRFSPSKTQCTSSVFP